MKDYLKTMGVIALMLGIIVLVCVIGVASKCMMYIEMFLVKHIWVAVIIAIALLVSYIKSVIRKFKE